MRFGPPLLTRCTFAAWFQLEYEEPETLQMSSGGAGVGSVGPPVEVMSRHRCWLHLMDVVWTVMSHSASDRRFSLQLFCSKKSTTSCLTQTSGSWRTIRLPSPCWACSASYSFYFPQPVCVCFLRPRPGKDLEVMGSEHRTITGVRGHVWPHPLSPVWDSD